MTAARTRLDNIAETWLSSSFADGPHRRPVTPGATTVGDARSRAGPGGHDFQANAVPVNMKLMRTAVLAGLARRLYSESRKPENQARIKSAVAKLRGGRISR
jgi:hypothetical protein